MIEFIIGFAVGLVGCLIVWVMIQVFLAWWFVIGGFDGIRQTHEWNKAQRKLKKEQKKQA